jgi:hypothetical protein
MKTSANYRPTSPVSTQHGRVPSQGTMPRAIVTHFLSRAAHGHTWNADATFKRRGLS